MSGLGLSDKTHAERAKKTIEELYRSIGTQYVTTLEVPVRAEALTDDSCHPNANYSRLLLLQECGALMNGLRASLDDRRHRVCHLQSSDIVAQLQRARER